MTHLFEDPDRRKAMGESGRLRVERHFSLEEMIEGTVRVYQRVAG